MAKKKDITPLEIFQKLQTSMDLIRTKKYSQAIVMLESVINWLKSKI